MPKNIIVCLDGTGNQLKAKGNTNVVRLYQLLDLRDPSRQIAYYDPGVGTFSAAGALTPPARRLSKLCGLAFGSGIKTNLAEAYTYLMQNYLPGDKIFVFGFSRGAYTARALVGLLKGIGLLRPGLENLVPYAISVYAKNKHWTKDDWAQLHKFAGTFSNRVRGRVGMRIQYLGLWDTVKAAGILRWELRWPYTRQVPNVYRARHAVSIDEKRRPYEEYLVAPNLIRSEKDHERAVEEVWFAGVHSDVGGTFDDDPSLSSVALKWIVDGAVESGLLLKERAYARNLRLDAEDGLGKVHRMGRIWCLLTYKKRVIPEGAKVHESVRRRMVHNPEYRERIPDSAVWADKDWIMPRG